MAFTVGLRPLALASALEGTLPMCFRGTQRNLKLSHLMIIARSRTLSLTSGSSHPSFRSKGLLELVLVRSRRVQCGLPWEQVPKLWSTLAWEAKTSRLRREDSSPCNLMLIAKPTSTYLRNTWPSPPENSTEALTPSTSQSSQLLWLWWFRQIPQFTSLRFQWSL